MQYILITVLFMNLITYIVFGIDKRKAVKHQWRISEKTLLMLSFFSPLGAFIGMKTFHHKTKKLKFAILVPLFLFIQIGVFVYFFFIF